MALETRTVKLDIEYTVTQAGMREAIRRVNAIKQINDERETLDELDFQALVLWASMAGCITPQITRGQFLQMREQDIDALLVAVRELNPHWFDMTDQKKIAESAQSISND